MAAPDNTQIETCIQALFQLAFVTFPPLNAALQVQAVTMMGPASITNWDEVDWDEVDWTAIVPTDRLPWDTFTELQKSQIKAQCQALQGRLDEMQSYLREIRAAAGV